MGTRWIDNDRISVAWWPRWLLVVVLTAVTLVAPPVSVDALPGGTPAEFQPTQTDRDGNPLRWNPCVPITWKVNLGRMPKSEVRVIARALRLAGKASGLTFAYQGIQAGTPTQQSVEVHPGTDILFVLGRGNLPLSKAKRLWVEHAGDTRDSVTRYHTAHFFMTDEYLGWRPMNVRQWIYMRYVEWILGIKSAEPDSIMTDKALGRIRYGKDDLAALRAVGRQADDCRGTGAGGDGPRPKPIPPAATVSGMTAAFNDDKSLTVSWVPGPGATPMGPVNADEQVTSGTSYDVAPMYDALDGEAPQILTVAGAWYPQTSITLEPYYFSGRDPGDTIIVELRVKDHATGGSTTQEVRLVFP